MDHFIGKISTQELETGAISELNPNLALVTGRLPVSAAVCHTHRHPETPHQDTFQSQLTGWVQLHTVVPRAISHTDETYCCHSDVCATPLPAPLQPQILAWPCFRCILSHSTLSRFSMTVDHLTGYLPQQLLF